MMGGEEEEEGTTFQRHACPHSIRVGPDIGETAYH